MTTRASALLDVARRRINREAVLSTLRYLSAAVFFAVGVMAMFALVLGVAFDLGGNYLLFSLALLTVTAFVAGMRCVPGDNLADPVRVWDTVGGVPVSPDSPGPQGHWDADLERLFEWDPYGSPHSYQIRPAVPPADEAGRDG